jgi:hypothetical protein
MIVILFGTDGHIPYNPEPKSSGSRLAPEPAYSEALGEPTILKWFEISPRANQFKVWARGHLSMFFQFSFVLCLHTWGTHHPEVVRD